jgi:ankyrin repeat protein
MWAASTGFVSAVQALVAARWGSTGGTVGGAAGGNSANNSTEAADTINILDMRTVQGESALSLAAANGHAGCAQLLMRAGARCDNRNRKGTTPLMEACWHGHSGVVRAMLAEGNGGNGAGNGVNTTASSSGFGGHHHPDQYINPDAQNHAGDTALMWACERGHASCVELLLGGAGGGGEGEGTHSHHSHSHSHSHTHHRCGVDPDITNNKGNTALVWAVWYGRTRCVRLLLAGGADASIPSRTGDTALMWSCWHGLEDCARMLLRAMPSPLPRVGAGAGALEGDATAVAEVAIATVGTSVVDVGVNATNHDGATALVMAVCGSHEGCVRALLEAGADEGARCKGKTARQWAVLTGKSRAIARLLGA